MTFLKADDKGSIIVKAGDHEVLGEGAPTTVRLLADASATGGALSCQRVVLGEGVNGATPHHHNERSEVFYVLGGALQVLTDDKVHVAHEGDLLVVPPGATHAFGAASGKPADVLIMITPGVERFEYFRLLARLQQGHATIQDLLDSQELYDNHFSQSEVWEKARAN
jgi:mannose-6-phosphate isomerase-like protein (cupin superfamily)